MARACFVTRRRCQSFWFFKAHRQPPQQHNHLTLHLEPLTGKGPVGLSELLKAYEFTLDCVGHDLSAGSLWLEFISFLSEPDIGTPAFSALFPSAVAGQEESQRVTVLRWVGGLWGDVTKT